MNKSLDEIYYTTDTVVDWIDIFSRPRYKHIVLDSYNTVKRTKV